MSPETAILAAVLAGGLYVVRSRWPLIAGVWRGARRWEKGVLVLALLPIPGPFDEFAGLLVARRVGARASSRGVSHPASG